MIFDASVPSSMQISYMTKPGCGQYIKTRMRTFSDGDFAMFPLNGRVSSLLGEGQTELTSMSSVTLQAGVSTPFPSKDIFKVTRRAESCCRYEPLRKLRARYLSVGEEARTCHPHSVKRLG